MMSLSSNCINKINKLTFKTLPLITSTNKNKVNFILLANSFIKIKNKIKTMIKIEKGQSLADF
jgi:hypothetical protein